MKVKCIKNVIMDTTNQVAFIQGREYEASTFGDQIKAKNEQGNPFHTICDEHNKKWFNEYFITEGKVAQTKYILLYNLDDECLHDEQMKNRIIKAIPEAKILEEHIIRGKSCEGRSIWIPESKYLIAWTIANYEHLLDIGFYDDEYDITSDEGVEWFGRHQNDESLVRWE